MRSPARAAILALLLVVAAAAAPGAADEPARQTMRIDIAADGDARWTVTVRFALDSANETAAFDRLAAEFEAGEADALSVDPFRRAASLAAAETGRSMTVGNVTRRAARANGTGRLVLGFAWTAFARRDGNALVLGDVFRTGSGTWLPRLTAEQELIIAFPEGFGVVSSSRPVENRSFDIEGPATFGPGEPSARLVRGGTGPTTTSATRTTATTTTTTTATTATTTTVTTTTGSGSPVPTTSVTTPRSGGIGPAVGAGGLAALAVAIALLVARRRGWSGEAASAGEDEGPDAPPDAEEEEGETLLSDAERVLRLLHANDGRMKQARIVEETGWSNAKVSQLLSEMEEDGVIDKLRIGRENLISLPGEGPDEGQ